MAKTTHFGPVTFINGENRGRYPFCNSIFIEEAGVLIDPASDRAYLQELHTEGKVKQIWLSHWHEDHIKHLDIFDDIPLCMHANDTPPLSDSEIFMDWYGFTEKNHPEIRQRWNRILKDEFHFKPRQVSSYLEDGMIIDLGSTQVEIIHCPGHSPGNLAFNFIEPEVLFIGDNDLTPFGPWYGDIPSDIDQILSSIDRLKKIPAKVWVAGHEDRIFRENPEKYWEKFAGVIQYRENRLLEYVSQPRTIEEIARQWIVYRKPIEPVAEFLNIEKLSMQKHLNRLMEKGRVGVDKNHYYQVNG